MDKPSNEQILYHIEQTVESQTSAIIQIQKDLRQIQIDIGVMKQTGMMPKTPSEMKVDRIKDATAGGSAGAMLLAVILAVIEYFKGS